MPGFPSIDESLMQSLLAYLKSAESTASLDKKELTSTPQQQINLTGAASYAAHCAICHGDNREGIEPSFPALLGAGSRMNKPQMLAIIHEGKGRMPGFPSIPDPELAALLSYLGISDKIPASLQTLSDPDDMPYQFTGYRKFLDQDGYPAIAPPWGTLSAVDLNTGKYLWHIPLGEYPELAAKGMTDTGSENYGGPIVTAGGLVIIGATVYDKKIRAFDSHTGRLLWSATLPYAGVATPITYMVDGKQYIVIATGGGRDPKSQSGGEYVALALP